MAAYDVASRTVHDTFSIVVRPRVNPVLSDYCVALVNTQQPDIDAAEELPQAIARLERWIATQPVKGWPTCAWGGIDRRRLAMNAAAFGLPDPLAPRPHVDLCAVMTALADWPKPIDRDEVRRREALPPNPRRHRALDDALDLTHFLPLMMRQSP